MAVSLFAADKLPAPKLLDLARHKPHSSEFRDALTASLGQEKIQKGTAAIGEGPNFLWAVESKTPPQLVIDDGAPLKMKRLPKADHWFALGTLEAGRSHAYHYLVNGAKFGGDQNLPAFLPEAYSHPGVPQGKLSDRLTMTSKIYDGMTTEYWIYVPVEYDANTPAALMVWQDGQSQIDRDGPTHTLNTLDNLISEKKIPVMISVFIRPGSTGKKPQDMRSIEYDTVSDRYPRFLREELLPLVEAKYNIRKDAYSHGITGLSSGGICSFNAAWFMPDFFTRVWSRIGSFTSIQWKPGETLGGNDYPFMIRKQEKRNMRVWLSDGSEDLENRFGSWPLQNIQMANSLKMEGYDFHFHFLNNTHNGAEGNSEMPTALTWLWRDYDPAKTEQQFTPDPAEKDKPYFRVKIYSR